MRPLFISTVIIASLAWAACTVAPTPIPPPTDTPTPITITLELDIVLDLVDAADVLLNPTPMEGGLYVHGRTVTIDVLPKTGWQIDRWVGPVYEKTGESAKIDMNSSQTVIVRLMAINSASLTELSPSTA